MATNLIPPLNCKGLYTLRSPWVTDNTRVYTCVAQRRFIDLSAANIDVLATFYTPNGLTQDDYDADAAAGSAIITLANDYTAPVYVPSTYIVSYPDMSAVAYSHTVLSISLGALYDGISLDFLTNQLAGNCSAIVGVTPTVIVNTAPLKTAVTPEEHQTIEAARNAAITNRTTDAATILALQTANAKLTSDNATLTQLAIDNGWVS